MQSKSSFSSAPPEENLEEDAIDSTKSQNFDPDLNRDETDMYNEDINNLQSSDQHRKTIESIATGDGEQKLPNENKKTKTFLGSHNSKNRRRKKLRKT